MPPAPAETNHPDEVFLTTRWSRVILAGALDEKDAHQALAELLRDYWQPLYFFARRRGYQTEDAQDLTQGFIAEILANNTIARAQQERGRFRTFGALFTAVQPHLAGGGPCPGCAKIAAELGLTENALTVAVHRMRKRYGTLLRAEIAATVADESETEDELRHLMATLSS